MSNLNELFETDLLHQVAELDALPVGAYNIRSNGGERGPQYHGAY